MKPSLIAYLDDLEHRVRAARNGDLDQACEAAVTALCSAAHQQRPILVCGNGGSAADAMHIVGELVGLFLRSRRAIDAVCLSSNPAVLTSLGNDIGYENVFLRQVEAHAREGGVLWGISTSGNSENVVRAMTAARSSGMTTLALTGEGGGKMAAHADILLAVPNTSTPHIQEMHLPIYHYICERVEAEVAAKATE
jgi:D-sedoheptulose 7-phosphate isomerase